MRATPSLTLTNETEPRPSVVDLNRSRWLKMERRVCELYTGSCDLYLETIGYVNITNSLVSVWNSGPVPIPYPEVYFGVRCTPLTYSVYRQRRTRRKRRVEARLLVKEDMNLSIDSSDQSSELLFINFNQDCTWACHSSYNTSAYKEVLVRVLSLTFAYFQDSFILVLFAIRSLFLAFSLSSTFVYDASMFFSFRLLPICVRFCFFCRSLSVGTRHGYRLYSLNSAERPEMVFERGKGNDQHENYHYMCVAVIVRFQPSTRHAHKHVITTATNCELPVTTNCKS